MGGDRLRLFVALPLPERAVERLVRWQRQAFDGPPGVRLVPRENLHVTVAFLGARPASDVEPIVAALADAAVGSERFELQARAYRETRSVGMLVLEEAGGGAEASVLVENVHERLSALGMYARERRSWLPHVTVVRFRERPRLSPAVPDLGAIGPSEVALYHSVLRPSGAQYEIRESVALGGSDVGS